MSATGGFLQWKRCRSNHSGGLETNKTVCFCCSYGQMARSFSYRNKTVLISLYKTHVRPHLEYCIQAWNPRLIKDKEILNKKKRAISMTSGVSWTTYEDKLREVGLTTLENRRQRRDMIHVWKILFGQDHVNKNKWFSSAYEPWENESQTRMSSDPLNLKIPVVHTEIWRNFFSLRVINMWNDIPYEIKRAVNLNIFKKSSTTGGTTERQMKFRKRCFELSHPWYITI